jgi:hypothetical protein
MRRTCVLWEQLATTAGLLAAVWLCAGRGAGQPQPPQIQPGTALAKLVAESKQHPLAVAAAAPKTSSGHAIRTDLPVWLRAHYMRNHPQTLTAAKAKDPTGGFPLALDSLYVWMLLNQDLKPPAPPELAAAAPKVAVGQNVRISGFSKAPRSESDIRISFTNPDNIIAASNNLENGRQAQFFSTNGGAQWEQSFLPLLPGDSMHSDPTVDWTSDGTAWATTIGISAGSSTLQMRSYKSTDSGKTWTFDGTFSGDQTSADKQMMCVDRSPTSPFKDTIHVIWHNNRPAFVNRRVPNGPNPGWQSPLPVSGNETAGTAIGSDITTNSAGHVFAVWPDTGSQKLFFVKSTNGGQNYDPPKEIGKTIGSFQIRVPAFAERAALVGVSIAAFRDANRDDVYVSWVDLSGQDGCTSPDDEPGNNVKSKCKSRIWFIRGTNGGAQWGEPKRVNDAAELSDQFNQKLTVDPETGVLGIVYYNSGVGTNRKKTDLVFQFSSDHGETWSKPTPVTSAMTDETTVSADAGNQYGDYNGLSVVKGAFFPCWTDRRDNKAECIMTAKITVTKTAAGTFEATLAHKDKD